MEYLAERQFETFDEFLNFKNSFQDKLTEIEKEGYQYRIGKKDITVRENIIDLKFYLKSLSEEMPEDLKNRIVTLFREHTI